MYFEVNSGTLFSLHKPPSKEASNQLDFASKHLLPSLLILHINFFYMGYIPKLSKQVMGNIRPTSASTLFAISTASFDAIV